MLSFDVGEFRVKTVDSAEEREATLRLRHDVFHVEHHGRILPSGLDVDDIDLHCDHLAIVDRRTGAIAGSYRLTSSRHSKIFYASKRFELAPFLALPGDKLELGRACVARGHRNGVVLHLLWRGIAEYVRAAGARFLFGSASVRTQDPARIRAIYDSLVRSGVVTDEYGISTKEEFVALDGEAHSATLEPLPPLFQSYLRAGAKVAAPPALDPFLGSADFLTVLPVEAMTSRFAQRYRRA